LNALGKHLLIELEGCDPGKLNDLEFVRETLMAAARETGSTILGESFHRFSPQGVSGVVVIAESHLSIHTWPEHSYAAADVFTCGTRVEPRRGADYLVQQFQPRESSVTEYPRGLIPSPSAVHEDQAVGIPR
jgi:S-adenosylmethionine decarboxylase